MLLCAQRPKDRSVARESAEHQVFALDGESLGDHPFAVHELARATYAVGGNELTGLEIEATEITVTGGVTAENHFVVSGVEAGDLQLEVILI